MIPASSSPGTVRHPVGAVLINGAQVPWVSWDVTNASHFVADNFSVVLPLKTMPASLDGSYWRNTDEAVVEVRAGFADDAGNVSGLTSLIVGNVDTVRHDLVGRTLTLAGRDLSSRFLDHKTTEKFQNQTSSQIAATLAARRGLKVSAAATTTQVGRYYEIDHARLTAEKTEWELLTFLAQQEGFDVWVAGTTLFFQPPPSMNGQAFDLIWRDPSDTQPAQSSAGRLHVEHSLTVARDVIVNVKSFNQSQQVAFTKTAKASRRATGKQSTATPQTYSYTLPNLTPEQALQEAQRRAEEITRQEFILEADDIPADTTLSTRMLVRLSGTAWDGLFWPDAITRNFDLHGGFTMRLRAKNHPTRSVVEI